MDDLAVKEIFEPREDAGGSLSFLYYMAGASDRIGPWWSQARDIQLKALVKDSDHLSGVVATIIDAISTIPVEVIPRNQSRLSHFSQAQKFTDILLYNSMSRSNPSAKGYASFIKPAIQDYYSTDNGLFIAIDGPGKPDGPITGLPSRLVHLDSTKCMRTASEEYPVIYTERGKRYKLHQSRVIVMAANPDSDFDMNGVGFCGVSRCINTVQHLIDIGRYEQEKLGSRPIRGMMHIEGGGNREVKALDNLLKGYAYAADSEGFTRYTKIPIFGSQGTVNLIDFASLPDGFSKLTSTQLAMTLMALAFGVSTRFLAFAIGVSGTTKADAEVQEESMRSKGIATFIHDLAEQLNMKFLPANLMTNFDYQDDAQDKAAAEIRKVRAEGRKLDLESGVTTLAVERQMMIEDGELTREQYEELETEPEVVETKEKTYASTQFDMPVWVTREAAKIANKINQDDIEEIETDTHITLKYGITHNDIIKISEAASSFDDLILEFGELSLFENDNDVLKIDIILTPELRALYDAVSTTGSDDLYNGEYNPHLTIAYLKKGTGWRYVESNELTGKKVTISQITFSDKNRKIAFVPLGQRIKEKKSLATFRQLLRSQAWQLSTGQIGIYPFTTSLYTSLEIEYNNAWNEGAAMCGIAPDERSQKEQQKLDAFIREAKTHVFDLGSWIVEDEPQWLSIANRLELWQNRYEEVKAQAQVMACSDQKLEWQLGDAEHCSTCLYLDGRVMRASRWAELDVWPRDTRPGKLECHGYRCQCRLTPTTKRATSGRLPRLDKR